jgi:hypothetical protein
VVPQAAAGPATWEPLNGVVPAGGFVVGYFGAQAIDASMADDGLGNDQATNLNVGHRRRILYSRAKDLATGEVPRGTYTDASGSYPVLPSNALYVLGGFNSAVTSRPRSKSCAGPSPTQGPFFRPPLRPSP